MIGYMVMKATGTDGFRRMMDRISYYAEQKRHMITGSVSIRKGRKWWVYLKEKIALAFYTSLC